MELSRAHQRLVKWVKSTDASQRKLAEQLDVSPAYLSDILLGKCFPGRALANAIERATATWSKGPIKSEEWDDAEKRLARRVA